MSFLNKKGRYLLATINLIFMTESAYYISLGLWGTMFTLQPYGLHFLLSGIVTFAMNVLGLMGCYKENKIILKVFVGILVFVSIAEVILITSDTTAVETNCAVNEAQVSNKWFLFRTMSQVNIACQIPSILLAFGVVLSIEYKQDLPPPYTELEELSTYF